MRRCLALFGVGCLLGPVGDAGHVLTGTLTYDWYGTPTVGHSPLWFAVAIGILAASLGAVRGVTAAKFNEWTDRSVRPSRTVLAVAVFMSIYGVTGILPRHSAASETVGVVAMVLIAFLFWFVFNGHRSGLVLGAIAATIGTVTEIVLMNSGVSHYSNELFLAAGVPLWLPALYFAAGACIGTLDATLRAVGLSGRVAAPASQFTPKLGSRVS